MPWNRRLTVMFVVALSMGLLSTGPAVAQDPDSREVSAYVLTEASLAKFAQASKNLAGIPGACEEQDDDDEDSDGTETIDQMVAKLNAKPGAQAAVQSAGMTSRDYIVFMFSMMQSGMSAWALKQPGGKLPPGVSQANVDFFNKHETAMAKLGKDNACGKDDDGEEDSDE